MIRAGLTGGLASGKSFAGAVFESLGCTVIRADELGHQVLSLTGSAYAPVVQEFGSGILNPDLSIDRKRLAAQVFGNPEKLKLLNNLVHPAVFALEKELFAQLQKRDPSAIGILEAAILIETGNYRNFDSLILVWCTEAQQIERAMRRDSYTIEEVQARLAAQMPLSEKRRFAHYLIDTSGSEESTVDQVKQVYRALRTES